MKYFKCSLILAVTACLMTSCLKNDSPSVSGFVIVKPSSSYTSFVYANDTQDSLVFWSYGNWSLSNASSATWCSINASSGKLYTLYRLPVTLEENATNTARYADFRLTDTDNPSDGYATVRFGQYATRGDGAFGGLALVKSITGSDNSIIKITYDSKKRPTNLIMKNADSTFVRDMTFAYNDIDSFITVTFNKNIDTYNDTTYSTSNEILRGSINVSGQPKSFYTFNDGAMSKIVNGNTVSGATINDTVCYQSYTMNGVYSIDFNYAFKIWHKCGDKLYKVQAIYLNGQDLYPDSEHSADSIGIMKLNPDLTKTYDIYKTAYSTNDNRYCSIDVNQLIEGISDCDPFLLVSMFRYARNSKIISTATGKKSTKTVTTTLNSNKSVSTMKIDDSVKGSVTYTFTY